MEAERTVTPLTACQQQLLKLTTKNCAMAKFSLCSNIESTGLLTGMTKNRPRLSLRSRLGGLLEMEETQEETENRNGKLKWKTEVESGNGKAENW